MPTARVIGLSRQLCLGLAHAHERGIIHRDLKPENVIVEAADRAETPRIADFAFALAILRETGDNDRLTAAGVVLGTPAYMAPEHAIGAAMDHRVDLYALGVLSDAHRCAPVRRQQRRDRDGELPRSAAGDGRTRSRSRGRSAARGADARPDVYEELRSTLGSIINDPNYPKDWD